MIKVTKQARFGWGRKLAALLAVGVAVGAYADGATSRIRYIADTYLQSDGTQIIDTGYIASTNMRVEVVFTPLERQYSTYTRYVWGSNAGSAPASLRCSTYVQCNDATKMNGAVSFITGASTNTNWQGGSSPSTRARYKAVFDYRNRVIEMWSGDTKVYNATPNNPGFETDNCSLVIFGARQQAAATPTPSFKGRVYSFVVYDKGVLVRDMIPYGRGAVTGLLDRCSGKVYTKTRGNAFVLGTDDGYIRSDRAQRSGQYVNTGWYMTPQTKIEVDFSMLELSTTWQCVFGSLKGTGHLCALVLDGSKKFSWALADNDAYSWTSTGIAGDSARRTFTLDLPNATVTLATTAGTEYTGTIAAVPTVTATAPLVLFGRTQTNTTGVVTYGGQSSARIYGVRIWNNGTLVRNYVPRIVDNEEGLYDTVNGTLNSADLSGSSSTGKFRLTAGGDIECAAAVGTVAANADAYLQGRKSQGIQTDYYTSRKSRLEIDFGISAYEGTEYFFGAVATTLGNTNNVGMYYQKGSTGSNRNIQFRYWKGTTTDWPNIGESSASPVRYKAVMDLTEAKGYLYKTGVLKKTSTLNLPSGNFQNTAPLRIMSTQSDNGNCGYGRLYSFKIFDDGVLVHHYMPCVERGVAGVWDSVGKQFLGNYKTTDGKGFELHGAGVDGGGMVFTEQPQGGRLSRGHTATLTAFAPGAAGYQWLKNGQIVEGATERTLEVSYGASGTADTYQCVSYYNLFGYGASAEAQIENLPSGTAIIFR